MITSAGLVLAGTFAMLGTLPLVTFTEIGFAVALGVLLDTLVVRSVLVTALSLDSAGGCGGRAGWPPRRGRRQPPSRRGACRVPGDRAGASGACALPGGRSALTGT